MKKNLLVIDDDQAIRKSFELTFEDTEYNVVTAENGQVGIQRLIENNIEFIFLDLKMPDMNGVEVLRQIRKRNTAIPVYIITAFHQEFLDELIGVRDEGIKFQILRKPLKSGQLIEIVENMLDYKSV